jgi:RNA polymerase sigma-70 factor (ECF subfamily)
MKEKEHIFLDIFESHNDEVFRFVLFRVNSRETALDITQESFTKFWEVLIQDKPIENGKALIYHIARNKIIDHYRKRKDYSLDEMTEYGFDAEAHKIDPEVIDDVKNLLKEANELPDKYKEVLLLHVESGMDSKEIAKVLNISNNLASVRLHRAKESLKKNIKNIENVTW